MALGDELDQWLNDRDARIAREEPEVDTLRERLARVNRALDQQTPTLVDAGNSRGPSNMTGSRTPGGPAEVYETTHNRPQAVEHVISLHDLLLGSRAALTNALSRTG